MADRPTREFEASDGTKFVVRDYITGDEKWQIKKIQIGGLKATPAELADITEKAENKAIELTVVSVNGETANVVANVRALPVTIYDELCDFIEPIVSPKKKSQSS